jgi:hypothetical protein
MYSHHGEEIFCVQPFLGPLLFDNTDSDARDHCANERSTVTDFLILLGPIPFAIISIIYHRYARNLPDC